jgi:hypothetical protein
MKKRTTQLTLILLIICAVFLFTACEQNSKSTNTSATPPAPAATPPPTTPQPPPSTPPQPTTAPVGAPTTMEVAKAVMVTVELDFGQGKMPTIAEAVRQIERQYKPDDGIGRTFSILDAYGQPTPDGKLLHIQMHVSSEKSGKGKLVFKRTGEVLWDATITPSSTPPPQKALRVIMGPSYSIDVTKADTVSILDSPVVGQGKRLRDIWLEGMEQEFTFIFSACGCPVKAMVKRVGEKTQRTSDMPVLFPDDPEALRVISKLMRW